MTQCLCSKCGTLLKAGMNIGPHRFEKGPFICNSCANETRKKWRVSHKEQWLKTERNRNRSWRLKVIQALGGRCSNPNCKVPGGMDDWRVLQIDHVNGGGRKELTSKNKGPQAKYYREIYEFVLANPQQTKYALLCANCNGIKRWTHHENVVD